MEAKQIEDTKLYELMLQDKRHQEDKRDQINNNYITLITALIGAISVIDYLNKNLSDVSKGYAVRIAISAIAFTGLILSILWRSNLKRILFYINILEDLIFKLEAKNGVSYLTYINKQSKHPKAPGTVTKYQIVLPDTFIIIFICGVIYSFSWVLHATKII